MRKNILYTITFLLLVPFVAIGQTYTSLWKQEQTADNKDLPRIQLKVLEQIAKKAEREQEYGHLLKATVKEVAVWGSISSDSISPAIEKIIKKEQSVKSNVALRAVYDAAIGRIYSNYDNLIENGKEQAKKYYELAMARPDKLASTKTTAYEPIIEEGTNSSSIFNDDLLSVIGYETKQFDKLHTFYSSVGNRRAACITALEMLKQQNSDSDHTNINKSKHIQQLDSLIREYKDLDVAGEIAVERYMYMDLCDGVTAEDKIKYIHYALEQWGGWQRMGELRNSERSLTTPQYVVRMDKGQVTPQTEQTVRLKDVRNMNSITVRIYKSKLNGDTDLAPGNARTFKQLKPELTLVAEKTQTFTGQPDYQMFNDSIILPGLPVGVYVLEFVSSPSLEVQRGLYRVSDVFSISQPLPDGSIRYAVVNATTGQPLAGAKLRITSQKYGNKTDNVTTLTTNAKGEVIYKPQAKGDRNVCVYAYTDADRAAGDGSTYGSFYYNDRKQHQERTTTLTDRAVYRPGQTVHVSAIVCQTDDNINYTAVADKSVKVRLRNANYEVVTERDIKTDKYGTCSIDLTLPTGKLTGNYTVMVNNGMASFRVEEYKRPTFYVEFPKVSEKYQNGDTIVVKAKAISYTGIPVQDAKVSYTVMRRPSYWWTWNTETTAVMKNGEATTASDGTFTVEMPMVLPDYALRHRQFYNFTVTADVTDMAGESHRGEMSVPLGSRTVALSSTLQNQMLADSIRQITFNLRNASGIDVNTNVRFRFDDSGEWLTAKTTEPYTLTNKFSSGKHTLFAMCEGDTLQQTFTIFSLNDTKPATETDDWFYVSSKSFPLDGSPVTVQVGSSAKDIHIVYSIFSGTKTIDSGSYDISDALKNIKLAYKEEYGNGLFLTFAWVKNGHCYEHTATVKRSLPDRKLRMEWATFRDRLTPGQKEEWTLKVSNPDGTPADAQLMATLYDKSLDQINNHQWTFTVSPWLPTPNTSWNWYDISGIHAMSALSRSWLQSKTLDFSHFSNDAFQYFAEGEVLCARDEIAQPTRIMNTSRKTMAAKGMNMLLAESKALDSSVSESSAEDAATGSVDTNENTSTEQMRENLNETAFFFPTLQTNSDGNVVIKFTLPESLTTWRFMGLAHTTDMMSGQIDGEAIAQKPIMVQPNVPRFVRTGDKAQISTRIYNNGGNNVNGIVRMTLIDPETEEEIFTQEHNFAAEAGKTAIETFEYQPNDTHSLLVCKITAIGHDFSDGEQHYLPILPNKERVTVTIPFTQNEPSVKSIDITKMFPKGTERNKLTVEYTNNPAWLVVQALPYVASTNDDNAISQATALYANAIGRHMANNSPKIKQTFAQWKQKQSEDKSLCSALSKNEELKDIAIDETPWLNDTDRETEQKMRMADFFDENTINNRLTEASEKLGKLQNTDGSWSWWQGMDGSMYITTEVACMLTRMQRIIGNQNEAKQMLQKALSFMDNQTVKMVEKMKSEERKGYPQSFPGITPLEYLYTSAIAGRTLSNNVKSAQTYLLNLLKKETKGQNIYEKALSAIVFALNNETTLSKEYAQSLKEYLVYSEEMGSYYDTHKATYSWYDYKIPTHVAAMEAIETILPADTKTHNEMQRWLLQEKRTQAWDTPINSANAIYAFLRGNTTLLTSQEQATLAIDGKKLDTPKATAGIGYVKTAIEKPQGKTFTATKTSTGTSWGALYAQFSQKTADITPSNSAISVKREIATNNKELKVGDRIKVRITIESKRDLDFVQVIDRRAAFMEPTEQLSDYRNGFYCTPKDNTTNYFFDRIAKGRKVVIETEYYIDRAGEYETGTCTAGCAYAPEYRATAKSLMLKVKE